MSMDSLLCDEKLFTSPTTHHQPAQKERSLESFFVGSLHNISREDCENAITVCLEKELSYMPETGYMERLYHSSDLMATRFRVVVWFIKCGCRLNLSFETVFYAANYLDRFISINLCNNWNYWMIELLSVSCLSIAAKFNQVSIPSLHELQMEGLDHSFESSTIRRMELAVMKVLGWRLGSITSYSYVELLTCQLENIQPHLYKALTSRNTELLFGALLDPKFLEFRPCTVAMSAIRCSIDELIPSKSNTHLSHLTRMIPSDPKEDTDRCYKIMEERVADPVPVYGLMACGLSYNPSSPVTVITMEQINKYDCYAQLSLLNKPDLSSNLESNAKKRKRAEDTTSNDVTYCDPSSQIVC